jgi:dolichol-phosphate mannosyltransferase
MKDPNEIDPGTSRPLISVIVPVFNEAQNIVRAYEAIDALFRELAGRYRLELIFSDNHSIDGTFDELVRLAAGDPRVKVLRLARNFGFQKSVLTGYRLASGNAAVQIDCDLQDPPQLIASFLELWEQGHDVVVGIRRNRREPTAIRWGRLIFYRFLTRISDDNLLPDAGDFRLVDRSILNQLKRIHDARPYLRGLISSLAARQTGIVYDRSERQFGRSKFPLRRLVGFAADGIISHSLLPLRLAVWAGFIVCSVTAVGVLYFSLAWLIGGRTWPGGFATTTILLLVAIGLNSIFLGIVGEYVGRIYNEVRVRPVTIVEKAINFDNGQVDFNMRDKESL